MWPWPSRKSMKQLIEGFDRNLRSLISTILRRRLYQTIPNDRPFLFNPFLIGFLQLLCIFVKKDPHLEATFVLARSNYKVYANLGLAVRSKKRVVVILNNRAGSSFITVTEASQAMRYMISTLNCSHNAHNAILKPTNRWDHRPYCSNWSENRVCYFHFNWTSRNLRRTWLWLLRSKINQTRLDHHRDGRRIEGAYLETAFE